VRQRRPEEELERAATAEPLPRKIHRAAGALEHRNGSDGCFRMEMVVECVRPEDDALAAGLCLLPLGKLLLEGGQGERRNAALRRDPGKAFRHRAKAGGPSEEVCNGSSSSLEAAPAGRRSSCGRP